MAIFVPIFRTVAASLWPFLKAFLFASQCVWVLIFFFLFATYADKKTNKFHNL